MPSKHYAYLGPFITCLSTGKTSIKWRYGCPTHGGEWRDEDAFCNLCGTRLRHTYEVNEDIDLGGVWDAFINAGLKIVDTVGEKPIFEGLDHTNYWFVPVDELWLVPTDTPNRFVQGTDFAVTDINGTDEQCALRARYAAYFEVLETLFEGQVMTEFGLISYRS